MVDKIPALEIVYQNLLNHLGDTIYELLKSHSRSVPATPVNNFIRQSMSDLSHEFSRIKGDVIRSMYFFYLFSNALYKYNDELSQVSDREFRAHVYYPIVIYVLVRYFPELKSFIQKQINYVYSQLYRNSRKVIAHFTYQYNIDQNIIKFDIFYIFVGSLLKKYNPLNVRNPSGFYRKIFETLYDYYLLRSNDYNTRLLDSSIVSDYISTVEELRIRGTDLALYQEVLYSLQIEKIVEESPIIQQIHFHYDVLRNIIIPHQLQRLFITSVVDRDSKPVLYPEYNYYQFVKFDYDSHNYKNDNRLLDKLRTIPTVYQLLKSVHIYSDKSSITIDKNLIETFVYEELLHLCRGLFNDNYIEVILHDIAKNFTKSITTGEYINLLTLSRVEVNQITFPNQLRKFIRMCFSDSFVSNSEVDYAT